MKIKSYIPDYQQPLIKKFDKLSDKHRSFADLLYNKMYDKENKGKVNA